MRLVPVRSDLSPWGVCFHYGAHSTHDTRTSSHRVRGNLRPPCVSPQGWSAGTSSFPSCPLTLLSRLAPAASSVQHTWSGAGQPASPDTWWSLPCSSLCNSSHAAQAEKSVGLLSHLQCQQRHLLVREMRMNVANNNISHHQEQSILYTEQ